MKILDSAGKEVHPDARVWISAAVTQMPEFESHFGYARYVDAYSFRKAFPSAPLSCAITIGEYFPLKVQVVS
jgi:hypothetical protein